MHSKTYKKKFLKKLNYEMHRFIPIYAKWQGIKVTEVIVNHFPRVHGDLNMDYLGYSR